MNRNILFARIGWGDRYVGEDLTGNFSEPNETNSWWERFNFTVGPGNRCYGFVPPLGRFSSQPNPTEKTDFLVILCSRPTDDDPLRPVGWYENATFEASHTFRPRHPGLKRSLRPLWNEMQYSLSTDAESTYLIPVENRKLFDPVPTAKFGRSFIYPRLQGNVRYPELVSVAKRILAMKSHAECLGTPHIGALMNDLQAAVERATNALEAEENLTREEARRRILTSILERPLQAQFRDHLMQTYSRCTISECDCPDVLEAAHIVPVSDGGSDHVTNGIVLRADLHRLFDLKKLTIHPTKRTVVVAPELKDTMYGQYDGKAVMSPSKLAHTPSVHCLKKHFDSAGL
jgi:HNH endonuclease